MRRSLLAAILWLLAAPLLADETLVLKSGETLAVKRAVRNQGKVRFETIKGEVREVPEADVTSPPLDALPMLLRMKNGSSVVASKPERKDGTVRFQTQDGQSQSVLETELASPALASIPIAPAVVAAVVPAPPVAKPAAPAAPPAAAKPAAPPSAVAAQTDETTLQLKSGDKLRVRRLVRTEGKVRFETLQGVVNQVAESEVVAPALESIPMLLRLASGEVLTVRRLARRDGKVRFETTRGDVKEVAESEVRSPQLASIPLFPGTSVAEGPRPEPTPAPTKPEPEPAKPEPAKVEPAKAARLADFEPMPSRWGILDLLPRDADRRIVPPGGPYRQSRLKGDKPIAGQDLFLVLTGTLEATSEMRRVPLPSGVSTERADSRDFFGNGDLFFTSPRALVTLELFKGQTSFRPKTFALKVTGAANLNYLRAKERNAVSIDPGEGTSRRRQDASLEEASLEVKLADLSPKFDVLSLRAGIQPFVSDFRGFIFSDSNLGARLFGNASNNRWQYNAAYFDLLEKETNSDLNLFAKRDQKVMIANVYRQDVISHGYTMQLSFHRSQDEASQEQHYDANGFLVRPARIGTPRLHEIRTNYAGWAGDGHLGRYNVSHALYFAFGTDDDNPQGPRFAGKQDISAQMASLELSIDRDWVRPKVSFFYASGDDDATDGKAHGFDTIYDNVNFAGGPFSFWVRSGIPLTQTAVLLKTPESLLPSLRSSKFEGQANFINPGLMLVNLALDADLTPRLKGVLNANYLRFAKTGALEQLLFQRGIRKNIGLDLGAGVLWRPDLSENFVITAGVTALLPGSGWKDIFSSPCSGPGCGADAQKLYNAFVQFKLTY